MILEGPIRLGPFVNRFKMSKSLRHKRIKTIRFNKKKLIKFYKFLDKNKEIKKSYYNALRRIAEEQEWIILNGTNAYDNLTEEQKNGFRIYGWFQSSIN